jgi:hypothetical protein
MQGPIPPNCCAALARAYRTESDLSQYILCLSLFSVHLLNNVVLRIQVILLATSGVTQHLVTCPVSLLQTTERNSQRCIETLDLIQHHRTVLHVMELRPQRISPGTGLRTCQAFVREKSTMHRPHQIPAPWNGLDLSLFLGLSPLGATRIQVGRCTTSLEEWVSLCSTQNHTLD